MKNFVSRNLVKLERREQLCAESMKIVNYNNVVIDMICYRRFGHNEGASIQRGIMGLRV